MIRAVVDTNVLFEGLTHLGPEGRVIDAWVSRAFAPCVSTALAFEYQSVLQRKLRPERSVTALKALQALLNRSEYIPIRFTYRPASRDPGDDFIVDCVLNGNSLLVTKNLKDFRAPAMELGFQVLRPEDFLTLLPKEAP